tara:strand:+ start:1004 stop:1537 length:534 start_codon:yes stop_codon:yes gene_type:complete
MMSKVNKKVLGWAFVVSLILWAILLRPSETPVVEESVVDEIVEEVVEEVSSVVIEEAEEVKEVVEDAVEETVQHVAMAVEDVMEVAMTPPPIAERVLNFTDDGILIAPYPDYDNFQDAFAFARAMLGDSAEHGELKIFLWRGNRYHTETLEQQQAQEEAQEDSIELETVKADTTVNN